MIDAKLIKTKIRKLRRATTKQKEKYEKWEVWGEVPLLRGKLKAYEEVYCFIENIDR